MIPSDIGIINLIGNAGLMVRFVLLLLLIFSITSWAIIIFKYRYLKKALKESVMFTDFFWNSKDFSEAFIRSKDLEGCPVARVFQIGYLELKKITQSGSGSDGAKSKSLDDGSLSARPKFVGIENVKRSLRRAINSEITKMSQMVPFLATTGNTAPFIGLFGTVWGIMNSFHDIGLRGAANLAVVAPGISEALVATAAGLAAAIPSVIAFNYFFQRINTIESEMISFSSDLLNIIERDILRSDRG
jgi:biopolymer transport protein TolQ